MVDNKLKKDSFHPDSREDFPDAAEDIADNFLTAYGQELETSSFCHADHAHDVSRHTPF